MNQPAPRKQMSPQKRFRTFLILTLLVLVAATLMVMTQETLNGKDVFEGQIDEMKMTTTRHDINEAAREVFYFTIKGLGDKFIISQNVPYDYSIYQNNLKPADKVKIYYDHNSFLTPEGFNQYVYQLEKGGVALLNIDDSNASNRRVGFVMYGIGLLALIGTIWYYRINVRVR